MDALSGLIQALPPAAVAAYEAEMEQVQVVLGPEAFSAAREVGRGLPLEEVIAEAVALAENW